MKILSKSLDETEKIARDFLATLKSSEKATVIGLNGNLGSGKTTFVQAVARILGIKESLTSPTFVIMKSYELLTRGYKQLVHVDAYRLEKGEDLEKLKIKEIFNKPENLVFIEWPENVKSVMPNQTKTLKFEFIEENTRSIEI